MNDETLSHDAWLEILSRHFDPEPGLPMKRHEGRYSTGSGFVSVEFEEAGAPATLSASLLQASEEGVMIKTRKEFRLDTPLRMSVSIEDESFVLTGHVVHCTQTIGGYKVGIRLHFPRA